MQILIDTDAFCKLGISGLLDDSVKLLGASLAECGRLPALPYMLRKGRLRRRYGPENCNALIAIAVEMPSFGPRDHSLLTGLVSLPDIDPGEAQLLSAVADTDLRLITGDKRSLRALSNLTGLTASFTGRIVVLESILMALCERLGQEEVREHVEGLGLFDKIIGICFEELNSDPVACLLSYFQSFSNEVRPLTLWHPAKAI